MSVIYKRNRNGCFTGINSRPPSLYHIHEWFSHCEPKKYFILYTDDTTLIFQLCSFIHSSQSDMDYVSTMINMESSKITDWLAVNKFSLNTAKTKFMLFHNYQKTINENDIPQLTKNDTKIETVTEFNFRGLIINEFMSWNSHASKISNKISRTLSVMNRLKRYLPLSAMKLLYCILILSKSKNNAHTDLLFKSLKLLTIKDIFDV